MHGPVALDMNGVVVIITNTLRKAMRNLLQHNVAGEVGLIFRWNNDDTTIETVWSEGYADAPGKLGFNRQPITRLNQHYAADALQQELGGHAEEIMIRNWEMYKRYMNKHPQIVDIILTHSPCFDRSNMFRDAHGTHWPTGCANKLHKLVNEIDTRVNRWNIGYFAYFGGPASRDNARLAVEKLQSHPKVATYFFHTIP